MERIDRPSLREDRVYRPGPVTLYLDDLEILYERIRQTLGDDCVLLVDVDGIDPRATYTHEVSSFAELREALGVKLSRGFLVTGGKGEFRLDFHPVMGLRVWAEGDKGIKAFGIAEEILRCKRRWFAPLLIIPAWQYMVLYAILETSGLWLWGSPTTLRVVMVAAFWCLIVLVQPEWSAGGLSKLTLVRRHERTVFRDIIWKILVPLFVGATLIVLRGCAAGIL